MGVGHELLPPPHTPSAPPPVQLSRIMTWCAEVEGVRAEGWRSVGGGWFREIVWDGSDKLWIRYGEWWRKGERDGEIIPYPYPGMSVSLFLSLDSCSGGGVRWLEVGSSAAAVSAHVTSDSSQNLYEHCLASQL